MASPLNRTGIVLDLASFIALTLFCISTEPKIIEQDILKRCQDALLMHHLPTLGLTVDGRDVLLRGGANSALITSRAKLLLADVSGVRTVVARVVSPDQMPVASSLDDTTSAPRSAEPVASQAVVIEVQGKIDQLLARQAILFKPDSTTLTAESEPLLDKIAELLTSSTGLLCEIRGYDTQPGELHQNWVLALQRALTTEDYLEGKGVADWRLSTRAFHMGEGVDGRRTDRSVDLVVRTRE